MTCHTGTVSKPRFESRPYKPAPARREHIHGPIQSGLPNIRRPKVVVAIARYLKERARAQ